MSRSAGQPPPRADRTAIGRFWRVIRRTEDASEAVACLGLWGIVAVLFFQMFFRHVLQTGLSWPDELARYLHILVAFAALGAVTRRGEHIRIDLFTRRVRPARLDRLLAVVSFGAAVVIAGGAAEIIRQLGAFRTPALAMPLALFFLPAALGFALMAIESVRGRAAVADEPGGVERGAVAVDSR